MVVKSLKSLLTLFIKTILFFSIRTDLLYQYCFPVSCYSTVDICCVITWCTFTWYANPYCTIT